MKEFQAVFQLSKTIIFEVNFYTLSTNQTPHFSTSAAQFARNKKDFTQCGQAQMELTKGFLTARRFFLKWDKHHLHNLTPTQYEELQADLQTLKGRYNFIYEELDESRRPYSPHFSFALLPLVDGLIFCTLREPQKRPQKAVIFSPLSLHHRTEERHAESHRERQNEPPKHHRRSGSTNGSTHPKTEKDRHRLRRERSKFRFRPSKFYLSKFQNLRSKFTLSNFHLQRFQGTFLQAQPRALYHREGYSE